MAQKPILPTQRQIAIFNALFEDGRAIFLKEQYSLGNIFLNEFGGIEMCWPQHMNIAGISESNTETRTKHRNKISAALRREGYGCGKYLSMGYFLREEMINPNFLKDVVTQSIITSINTRSVLIEKTKPTSTKLFREVVQSWEHRFVTPM